MLRTCEQIFAVATRQNWTAYQGAELRYGYECLYGITALRQLRRRLPVVEIEIKIEIDIAIEIEIEYAVEWLCCGDGCLCGGTTTMYGMVWYGMVIYYGSVWSRESEVER